MCAVLLLLPAGALAVQQTNPSPVPPEQETDLGDAIRAWRKKPPPATPKERMIIAAPVIGSNPSAGFIVGVAGQMAFYRGDPSTTRISSGTASLTISSKDQVVFNVRFHSFSEGNRWLIEGDNRFQSTSQDIYGFGTDTPSSAAVGTNFGFVRLHEVISRRVAGDLYVGGGFLFDSHYDVRPATESDPNWLMSPYIQYSVANGLPTSGQQSAGFSLNLQLNRRDNDISARHGWIMSGQYRASFDGFLGGDSSWQELKLDARKYVPLTTYGQHRIALWTYTSLVTKGVVPYFDAPMIVNDKYGRSARGYQEGRFRGEKLIYGEAEYRGPIMKNGLLGMVAFATLTTVSNKQTGEKLFDSVAPSAGGGLRLLLNKRSRTHLCLDFAWGKDGSNGVYLAIQDAF
jgi:outer membrane protein assembly factor BamA